MDHPQQESTDAAGIVGEAHHHHHGHHYDQEEERRALPRHAKQAAKAE